MTCHVEQAIAFGLLGVLLDPGIGVGVVGYHAPLRAQASGHAPFQATGLHFTRQALHHVAEFVQLAGVLLHVLFQDVVQRQLAGPVTVVILEPHLVLAPGL